jgi:hypothetical protein
MKKTRLIKALALTIFSLCLHFKDQAQTTTGTFTVLKQPCNSDGKLSVSVTSGFSPPLEFSYYTDNQKVVHSNVNSLTDVLDGISDPITSLSVNDKLGNYYEASNIGMVTAFKVDPAITTAATCPSNGTAKVTINGGTLPASIKWYENNIFVPGRYLGTNNPISLPGGKYTALVTDLNGCTVLFGADTIGINIDYISNVAFSVVTKDANCNDGEAKTTSPTGGIAPFTFKWSNGENSQSIKNLSQGHFSVIATDAQGCYASEDAYINQTTIIDVHTTVTPATCIQNDGSVIAFGSGGKPPYTYLYSNGRAGQTLSGLSGETSMEIKVTDANGCVGSNSVYIGTSTPISVTYSSTKSSCTAPTGSASLSINGGTLPHTVNWNLSPVQNGITIDNMPEGYYYFTINDAAGCKRTGYVDIQPESIMEAWAYSNNPVCPATVGQINAIATGSNPPFTYLWNTGSKESSVSGVHEGSYSCVITDNVGCTKTKYTDVHITSPVNIGFSSTPASCIYTNDGIVQANPTGGKAPYSYNWSNGQTVATATGLYTGYFSLTVTDANGCGNYENTFVNYDAANSNCYCTLGGKVYTDINNNCQYDAGENGIPNIMIHCSSNGYTYTNADGDYSFRVRTGNYTLTESIKYTYPLADCQNNNVKVAVTVAPNCTSKIDFANKITTIHDIHIVRTSVNNAVPGNKYTQGLIVYNDGTVNEVAIDAGKKHDGQLQYLSTSPTVYTQLNPTGYPNWYSSTTGFPTLAAGTSTMLYTDYQVPTNIPIGTDVNFGDTAAYNAPIANWLNDYTPWNNVDDYTAKIIGSYDPNFKEVSPAGKGPEGYITTADSVLDYVIHFQNTGSYYAQKIVVVDTLDNNLDWSSLQPGFSDHNYVATMSETGVVQFTFDNINLDWQAKSEMASRGLVSYSIKQQKHLAPGAKIKNSAAIYFDYNSPVITNKTLNTIKLATGITELNQNIDFNIYPNPASTELNIHI